MLTHQDILRPLADAFGTAATVASYRDAALRLQNRRAYVFIPDCHLLSPSDAVRYRNAHFLLDDEFATLVDVLYTLRQSHPEGDRLRVVQLGDSVDEWRCTAPGAPAERINGILASYHHVFDRLTQSFPGGLGGQILAGNHDYQLHKLADQPRARFMRIGDETQGEGQVLVLHGDQFDWVEALPEALRALAVNLVRWAKMPVIQLQQEALQDQAVAEVNGRVARMGPIGADGDSLAAAGPLGGGAWSAVNVADGDRAPAQKFYAVARELAEQLNAGGLNIRVIVIGHTHHARIVRGTLGDGGPFVLADCGAWFGRCVLPGESRPVLSAQVGVLVGDEIRVYQLGRREG